MVVKCFWKPDDPRINNMALYSKRPEIQLERQIQRQRQYFPELCSHPHQPHLLWERYVFALAEHGAPLRICASNPFCPPWMESTPPPPLPEANFYTRQPCQKFAPISELNCQDGRGNGTLGRWYKAIVRWNDVWLVRPLVRMCTQSFCNQPPPLNCRQFLQPLAMSPLSC